MWLGRERAKAPYSREEVASYLSLADAQPTESRHMGASAVVCLSAGAGLVGADLKAVTGADVVARSGGVVVCVRSGRRPRVVPVLWRYHDRLLSAARDAGDRLVIGGASPFRRNVTSRLTASLAGGRDLPRIEISRLRATWLCEVAGAIEIRAFMGAAGVAPSIEALLPVEVRPRQLGMRRLLLGVLLTQAEHRPAYPSRIYAVLVGLGDADRRRLGVAVDWTDVESFSTRRTKPDGAYGDTKAAWGHRKGGGRAKKTSCSSATTSPLRPW